MSFTEFIPIEEGDIFYEPPGGRIVWKLTVTEASVMCDIKFKVRITKRQTGIPHGQIIGMRMHYCPSSGTLADVRLVPEIVTKFRIPHTVEEGDEFVFLFTTDMAVDADTILLPTINIEHEKDVKLGVPMKFQSSINLNLHSWTCTPILT